MECGSSKSMIFSLPYVIVRHIFGFLPWYPDFVHISEVCKNFRSIARDSTLLENGGWNKISLQEAAVWGISISKFLHVASQLYSSKITWLDLSFTVSGLYYDSFLFLLLTKVTIRVH